MWHRGKSGNMGYPYYLFIGQCYKIFVELETRLMSGGYFRKYKLFSFELFASEKSLASFHQ